MKTLLTAIEDEWLEIKINQNHCVIEDTSYEITYKDGQMYIIHQDKQWKIDSVFELNEETKRITIEGYTIDVKIKNPVNAAFEGSDIDVGEINSPIAGVISAINVKEGDKVAKGDVLLIISAMKMENKILSTADGIVDKICVSIGKQIDSGTLLVKLDC